MGGAIPRRSPPGRAVAGWLLVALALLAAGGLASTGATAPGEIRVGVPRLPSTPDPAAVLSGPGLMVFRLIGQGLVEFGDRGEIEPGLAAQWSVSRDGLTWTFRLRPDVQFHDGTPVTAEDVVASLGRHVSVDEREEPGASWGRLFDGPARLVREVRAGESGTVQLLLGQPFSPLLAVLAHPSLSILRLGEGQVLGTGPYRWGEQGPGQLVLEAVRGGAGEASRPERIVLYETADDAAGFAGLAPGGALHVYFPESPPAGSGAGLQVLSAPSWRVGLLALRTDRGALRQKAVRQAVALSLDPELIQPALAPWAIPLAAFLPPGAWAAREAPPPAYDPSRARRLLAQARAPGPMLTLLVPDPSAGPAPLRLADAVRLSLAASGFKVRVRAEPEEPGPRASRSGEPELILHEVALDVNDPHFFFQPLLAADAPGTRGATNVAGFRSATVDGVLLRASQLGFRPERARLYHRLQAVLAEEAPYVPLYVRLQWVVARSSVRGLRLDPAGLHRLDRIWVEGPPEPPAPPPRPAAPPTPAPATDPGR